MTQTYAGIGSRETPVEVQNLMTRIARWLSLRGYTLRSGGAPGADAAFERGAAAKEIYLPWARFQGHPSTRCTVDAAALEMASRFHPAWGRCSDAARKLHARNCYQVLGPSLDDPVHFVVCWTKDGQASGGTGQALRIAQARSIPIFNLHDATAALRLHAFMLSQDIFA